MAKLIPASSSEVSLAGDSLGCGASLNDDATVRRNVFVHRIFSRYHEALFRFLRARLGSDPEAADVAQDAYVRLCRQRDLEKIRGRERSYLFAIASNLLKDRHRRQSTSPEPLAFEEAIQVDPADRETPQSRLEEKQISARVGEVLRRMDPTARQVFLLRRSRGAPYREIATELGVSERTIERHMQRALKFLKQELLDQAARAGGAG